MCKVCKAFEMEPGQARIDHLRRLEFVEAFGPQWKGKDLFEYDEGNLFLCRCPECDALVLKQYTVLHNYCDDDNEQLYYTWLPVASREEIIELNDKYDGLQLLEAFKDKIIRWP